MARNAASSGLLLAALTAGLCPAGVAAETIAQALDAPGTTFSGDSGWTVRSSGEAVNGSEVRSPSPAPGGVTVISTTLSGPVQLSFLARLSSASDGKLTFRLDGATRWTLSGTDSSRYHSVSLPAGSHQIRWEFSRTAGAPTGASAWMALDRVAVMAPREVAIAGSAAVPSPRTGASMAFDPSRSRLVMVGGGADPIFPGTWEQTGSTWLESSETDPPARVLSAAVSDTARARIVLFGGLGKVAVLGDTLERDATGWAVRTVSPAPPARWQHAMAWDEARGRTVLFGGGQGALMVTNRLADTWEWDGTAWQEIKAPGPVARTGHAMAWDPVQRRVVLYGGDTGTGFVGDFWSWDGTRWTQGPSAGPGPRAGHSLTTDAARQRLVLFGGNNGTRLEDTWEWNGTRWSQAATQGPPPRRNHAAAWEPVRRRVVIFGGANGYYLHGDQWEWDGTTWTRVPGVAPPARANASMAFDEVRAQAVLFGGDYAGSDTWLWDGSRWSLAPVPGPPGRSRPAMAWNPERREVMLCGGSTGTGLTDTWAWNGTAWRQLAASGFTAVSAPSIAWDASRRVMVLAAGTSTLEWNGTAWVTRVSGSAPALACLYGNPATGRVIGLSAADASLWSWSGSAWARQASAGPPAPFNAPVATVHPGLLRPVLLGMMSPFPTEASLWEWEGNFWKESQALAPWKLGSGAAVAFDSARCRLVIFGGEPVHETSEIPDALGDTLTVTWPGAGCQPVGATQWRLN